MTTPIATVVPGSRVAFDWTTALQGEQRDAFVALQSLFDSYGLGSLAPKIFDFIKQGYGSDTIALLLQETPEYKQRFAGNEARRKAGLPVLTPAQYLANETAYRQILQNAGMPIGFYDSPDDFASWIGTDVSPTEIKARADMAVVAATTGPPEFRAALKTLYGVDEGGLAAYWIDPGKAEPILRKQAAAAEIGAAAISRGFTPVRDMAELLATQGITGQQAAQGYGMISETFEPLQAIAGRTGEAWSQAEAEADIFMSGRTSAPGMESATAKRKRLASQERALFAGAGGASVGALGQGVRAT